VVAPLLVVTHSQTGGTQALTDAFLAGARDEQIQGVEVIWRDALDATPEDVLLCGAIALGTPENFGYMSGALKYFFDRIYYPCLDETRGRPYQLFVKARDDGAGAVLSVQRIVAGLAWREIQPPLVVGGNLLDEHLEAAHELGMTIAASLEMGIL
jgi:multimeric flavodoxin WrbA